MSGYLQVNIADILKSENSEEMLKKSGISSFSCPLNADVEYFLKNKAVEFAKRNLSVTYLVYSKHKGNNVLIGYFTLSNKFFTIKQGILSKTLQRKISYYGKRYPELKRYVVPAILIGQLGKNFLNNYDSLISGDELLKMACDKVADVQHSIGGKFVYLECEDNERLLDFYSSNGFVDFGKRTLDPDEVGKIKGIELLQMLKYLK